MIYKQTKNKLHIMFILFVFIILLTGCYSNKIYKAEYKSKYVEFECSHDGFDKGFSNESCGYIKNVYNETIFIKSIQYSNVEKILWIKELQSGDKIDIPFKYFNKFIIINDGEVDYINPKYYVDAMQ